MVHKVIILVVIFMSSLLTSYCSVLKVPSTSGLPTKNPNLPNYVTQPQQNIYLYEEDIVLSPYQTSQFSRTYYTGLRSTGNLWPNSILYYDFAPGEFNNDQQNTIESAIADLQKHTCVKFKRRDYLTTTYVYFRNTSIGCASPIGYQPVHSAIHLYVGGTKCQTIGTIQHELLHALGLWHEHTRPDRDKYIRVLWNNIQKGREYNFFIQQREINEMPYDYGSVMHYKPTAFSVDKSSPTIVPYDNKANIGQRIRFSRTDIAKLNRLYNCPASRYYKGDDLIRRKSVT